VKIPKEQSESYIEEEQTTQWPKEKAQKDKQRSTKHTYKTKDRDNKISICCFSAKHTALKSKSKYWLARNQVNVSEWSDMSTSELCFSELAL
jgi:hypothetical protein